MRADSANAHDEPKTAANAIYQRLLGAYLRARIGVPSGSPVAKRDLENYGRTDVTFWKIEDGTYYMDFSPP